MSDSELEKNLADTRALQGFLQAKLKPLPGVTGTETLVVLDTVKETTEVAVADRPTEGGRQ